MGTFSTSSGELTFTVSALVWIGVAAICGYCAIEQHQRARPFQRDVTIVLLLHVALRALWFIFFENHGDMLGMVILNRVVILLQCTAVVMMLLIWVRGIILIKEYYRRLKISAIVSLACVWIFMIGSSLTYNSIWRAINLLFIGVISLAIALAFLFYGITVKYKTTRTDNEEFLLSSEYTRQKRLSRRLISVCSLLAVCFALRAFSFSTTFFKNFPGLFPWCFYHVPEGGPVAIILIGLSPENGFLAKIFSVFNNTVPRASDDTTFRDFPRTTSITLPSHGMSMSFGDGTIALANRLSSQES